MRFKLNNLVSANSRYPFQALFHPLGAQDAYQNGGDENKHVTGFFTGLHHVDAPPLVQYI